MQVLSPGYWQEQDLELGTLAPLDEALSSTVWSSPDMLASQGEKPGPSSQCSPDASHPSSHHLPVVVLHPMFSRLSLPHSFLLPIWHLVLSSASTTTFPCTNSLSHSGTETSVTLHLFPKIRCPGEMDYSKNKEVLERHCQRGILQVKQGQRDLEVGDWYVSIANEGPQSLSIEKFWENFTLKFA